MPDVYDFLNEHDLKPVKEVILSHSEPEDIRKIEQNFSFIVEEGEEEIAKLAQLLTVISTHQLLSFSNILAVFRVEDFSNVLNLIDENELTQEQFDKIIKDTLEPTYADGHLVPIRLQISSMLATVGMTAPEILARVDAYRFPEAFLYALELFREDDTINIDTLFNIADMLQASSKLVPAFNDVYEIFDIHKVVGIANQVISVERKCEELLKYTKSLSGVLPSPVQANASFFNSSQPDNDQRSFSCVP